ncbi:MAG: hypothetical protein IT160_10810 [Bryobacterales bacterium]|nr:hypothetical protein [Bryobacterales bacterium]
MPISRRECLGALAPLTVAGASRALRLSNDALELVIQPKSGRRLHNRFTGETVELTGEEFTLDLEPGGVVRASSFEGRVESSGGGRIALHHHATGAPVAVRVVYSLAPGKAYLRKQISVRAAQGAAPRLRLAELENWAGVRRPWRSMRADQLARGSHPIYCDTWWAGVEFVAAANHYDETGFVLASRPGLVRLDTEWRPLHSTIIGVARRGEARGRFLDYIEDIRSNPPRMVTCYNSWWTLPQVVKQSGNLTLIRELKAGLFDPHGVFFDIVTTDMGWSDPRSIWKIDRAALPNGFDDIRPIVESAGGKLGLWMSPSEVYPPVCDYEWAAKSGYTVIHDLRRRPGISLADPRYRREAAAQLATLIREEGIGHIKYDGFVAEEKIPHHGLAPGADSIEPLAAHSLQLLQASKQANGSLVTEPTYLNSHANYISPWMLRYSDSVWANAGGDCPPGLTPAPIYREAQTSAREYYIFRALDEVWLPQNGIQHFDIVHVDDPEGFANHAAMAFARGRFFVPAYINPRLMAADDWRVMAGFIRWARADQELLRNTVEMPSRVELGEPYAYAHWQGERGVIAVRNPSNENRAYALDLARAGAPHSLRNAVCYTQYPYRRGLATGLDATSTLSVSLAPWELLYVEITPLGALREPIAIGARWYRHSSGAMLVAAAGGSAKPRLLQPGLAEREIIAAAGGLQPARGELLSSTIRAARESRWLSAYSERPNPVSFRYPIDPASDQMRILREKAIRDTPHHTTASTDYEVRCRLEIPPGAASAQALLLLQFPGRFFRQSTCEAELDGRPVTPERRDSFLHTGYYVAKPDNAWKDMIPNESEWSWYICPVAAGSHHLRFRGIAAHNNPKVGLWLWTTGELKPEPAGAGLQCSEPQLPQVNEYLQREGLCLKAP